MDPGAAPADPPLLAITVTDPSGAVALDDTLPLPLERTVSYPTHALGLWVAPLEGERAVVELVTGKPHHGVPKPLFARSAELDPFVPAELELQWKGDDVWRVAVELGRAWPAEPPGSGTGACVADATGPRTARALAATLEDGTGYVVAAGVPIEPRGDGTALVRAGDLAFEVRVAEGDVGEPAPDVSSPRFGVPAASPEVLGPGVVGRTALGEVSWTGAAPLPVAARAAIRAPVVTVRAPCAEVVLVPTPHEPTKPAHPPVWQPPPPKAERKAASGAR